MSYRVHINGRDFTVPAEAIAELRTQLLAAARAGGGFVDLPHPSSPGTSALVLPESAVWIEPAPGELRTDDRNVAADIAFVDVDAPRP
ncbi:hypothetical protein [Pseudoclavibacter helvolus]|uniref:hypothetical protein n=1 Tax=Pseudoclavibacter helvolus TaxID=255205 RepID=UPI003C7964C8